MKTQKTTNNNLSWIEDAEIIEEETTENRIGFNPELPTNYEQKCPLVILADVSYSMEGKPIQELNKGLKEFQNQILNDPIASQRIDCSIISFSSEVTIEQEFALIDQFSMPKLKVSGSTKMASAIFEGIGQIDARKNWYKETGQTYYRPFVILLTDGYPDNDQNIEMVRAAIQRGYRDKKFLFWAFGVEGADMQLLKSFGHEGSIIQKIKGTEFVKLFKWLSQSMAAFSNSKPDEVLDIKPRSEDENPFQIQVK